MKKALFFFEKGVVRIEKALTVFFCSVMCVTLFLQVLFRYVLKISVAWTEEVALISFLYAIFLAASVVVIESKHIGFDAIVSLFSEKLKFIVNIFVQIIVMIFLIVIIWSGYKLVLAGRTDVSTMLRIPMSQLYAIIPLTGCTMLLHSVCNFIREHFIREYGG